MQVVLCLLYTSLNPTIILICRAGKALGDKRANVGERAFGKPFNKIVIAECGPL